MDYRQSNEEKWIYWSENAQQAFCEVDKLIFDFDGVLVQTIQSYRQTVRKVVDYYFLEILALEGEEGKLVTLRDIQKFKDTGLYNNDWKLSYAFITYYLTLIMRELERKNALEDFTKKFDYLQFSDIKSFAASLRNVSKFLNRYKITAIDLADLKDNATINLDLFLAHAKIEKAKLIETSQVGVDLEVSGDEQDFFKKLVSFKLEEPDLLKRLFEEIYLGKELFTKFYNVPSFFKFRESLLDKEMFIATKETLDILSQRFGESWIYSGRPKTQAMYLLEKFDYGEYFNKKDSVFLGDLLKSEDEMEEFGKPDPTLFIELIEKLVDQKTMVAYVGDGIADAMLVNNARSEGVENLLFLGVMSSSEDSDKLFTEYRKHGADVIMSGVNDIPFILENLRGSV
jgi:phosphoglycolate phosphatase-like HAD superfamily hydrolase